MGPQRGREVGTLSHAERCVERPAGISRGHHLQGPTPVTAYALRSDTLAVEVWDHGARLVVVETADRDGGIDNLVLRHATLAGYDDVAGDGAYLGATIGRYANRIADSRFRLDGVAIELDANEGANQLHGGPIGFDQHVWTLAGTRTTDDGASVSLRHVSPSGDQGFPGTVSVETTYEVAGDRLRIDTVATTDAPTVIGSTNHAYWNLAGSGTVTGHQLRLAADRYLAVDDQLIPIDGPPLAVDGTAFDFRGGRDLAEVIADGGIDHCFVGQTNEAMVARLAHPASGRTMTVRSNQPGVQVYTGQYLRVPFSGVCLEPQVLPDTPNRPDFGSCELRPGDEYRHWTTYDFSCR